MAEPDPFEVVSAYMDAANRYDVDEALAHLDDAFQLEFTGGPTLSKEDMRSALGWDVGTEGRVDWDAVEASAAGLELEGRETNEFYRLLGAGPVAFRSAFRINAEGLITYQRHQVQGPGADYGENLAKVVEWARENEPEELAEIYPDEQLEFSEEMGRRWIALLRRWQEATAE